ncbi:MAG: hypothetical protein AUJ18_02105 [Candidatus Hydrogenedentes bacterium CG1_02_42_14]|nr:MAG: hypothetical protein AUJ18_02105 [Candidatus Hydrogenedentes bacterium CG1_02_42_14]
MTGIFFAHPHTLLDQVGKVLENVGSEKFFTSSDEEVKKAREGFAAYFFTLTLKKYIGRDWWLAQYDQAVRASPDFDFMSFAENPDDMKMESVELTGVYPHFKSFDEALRVVEKKQKQYGTEPVKFSLLVFVNHEKSEEWINMLREKVISEHPFLSIWTIHLRFKKGGNEVGKAVAQRIRPLPGLRVEADMDDPEIHKRQPLQTYMVPHEDGTVTFKTEFIDKIRSLRKGLKT